MFKPGQYKTDFVLVNASSTQKPATNPEQKNVKITKTPNGTGPVLSYISL